MSKRLRKWAVRRMQDGLPLGTFQGQPLTLVINPPKGFPRPVVCKVFVECSDISDLMEIREVPTLHVAKQMFSAYCPTMYRLMPARMWKQIRTQSKFAFDDRTLPEE